MREAPLKSLEAYRSFITQVLDRPGIRHSTVSVWSDSQVTGTAEGEIIFLNGIRLRLQEEIDFEAGLITSCVYEIYRAKERLYWYDDFPHINDESLTFTFPHHKHLPPKIRQHRDPAPKISFEQPNLPFLLQEVIALK